MVVFLQCGRTLSTEARVQLRKKRNKEAAAGVVGWVVSIPWFLGVLLLFLVRYAF